MPFWWCRQTKDQGDANLPISHLTISISILTNDAPIDKDQPLLYNMATYDGPPEAEAKAKAKGQKGNAT